MNAVKEAPDYLHDEHLSQGTKTYLNVLNLSLIHISEPTRPL